MASASLRVWERTLTPKTDGKHYRITKWARSRILALISALIAAVKVVVLGNYLRRLRERGLARRREKLVDHCQCPPPAEKKRLGGLVGRLKRWVFLKRGREKVVEVVGLEKVSCGLGLLGRGICVVTVTEVEGP